MRATSSGDPTGETLVDPYILPPGAISSPEELESESRKAVAGDLRAAERVAEYHSMAVSFSPDEQFWQGVAFENGSSLWIETKASQLAHAGGKYRCLRAIYLYERASAISPARLAGADEAIKRLRADKQCELASDDQKP